MPGAATADRSNGAEPVGQAWHDHAPSYEFGGPVMQQRNRTAGSRGRVVQPQVAEIGMVAIHLAPFPIGPIAPSMQGH